jgi:sugar/nucleoside kinase (ribokinase family)
MVTGHVDPRPAADVLLGRGARTAILKLGARGCAVYTGGHEILSPAFAVPVKDTTGAGDCFVGAFLSARLRGASLAEAARFANAVGRSGCSMWVEPRGYRTASTYQPGFAASAEALAKGSGVWVNMLMGTRQ